MMKRILFPATCAAAGFLLGVGIPRAAPPAPEPAVRLSPRKSTGRERESGKRDLAELTPAEWPGYFRAHLRDPGGTRLAERVWAEQDPAGFWNWLRQQHDVDALQRYGKDLMQVWASADPDAAMAAADSLTDKKSSDLLRYRVIETAFASDLEKGLELAAKAGDFNRFSLGPREWMKEDPAAAVKGLAALQPRSEYRDYLNYAVAAWAGQDSPAMLQWLKSRSIGDRDRWFGEAFKAAALADPGAALETAAALKDAISRDAALAGVLSSGKLATGELPKLLEQITPRKRVDATREILGKLPVKDAAQIAEATELLSEAPASRRLMYEVSSLARRQDWENAMAWPATLPDAALRRQAMIGLAEKADREHFDSLADMAATAPALDLSDGFFKTILGHMPAENREAWLAKLPPDRAAWAREAAGK